MLASTKLVADFSRGARVGESPSASQDPPLLLIREWFLPAQRLVISPQRKQIHGSIILYPPMVHHAECDGTIG
jgi:hypothetical protein